MRFLRILVAGALLAPAVWAQKPNVRGTRTITVAEAAGRDRAQCPVELTIDDTPEAVGDGAGLRLFRVEGTNRVACPAQILDVAVPDITSHYVPTPRAFVHLAFLADLRAGATSAYEVVVQSAAPAPAAPAPLRVSGAAPGRVIDTGPIRFEFHPRSGQLLAVTPAGPNAARAYFCQFKDRGDLAIHWNPDLWAPPVSWGHASDWNEGHVAEAPSRPLDELPAGTNRASPFCYREQSGPLLYRITRWGRMPFIPQSTAVSVTYTLHAGSPAVMVQSLVECRESMQLNAIRNAELVFSRGQFDTAVWIAKDGQLGTAPCYDYDETNRYFGTLQRLPPDAACVALASVKRGWGIGYVVINQGSVNRYTGYATDEQAQFYFLDTDMHGRGSPANFLYLARVLAYRQGYGPQYVQAGSIYTENSAIVVFKLQPDPAARFDELQRWATLLRNPPAIAAD